MKDLGRLTGAGPSTTADGDGVPVYGNVPEGFTRWPL